MLVFFHKPDVVLFFDNIHALDMNLIDTLINRLADQTSSIYVVSTCDSGPKELRVRQLQQGTRPYLFEPVYLTSLPKEVSNEIYAEVWKSTGGPLLTDVSLPGYIVLGSNPVLGKIHSLSEKDKKVIQALRLAADCGVLDCEEKLFWGILKNVLGFEPQDRSALLNRFIEQGMILVQNQHGSAKRVLVQHTSYLDEAYDDLSEAKLDHAHLADWLFDQGDANRMAALGSYYWNVLFDSSSARNIYERVNKLNVTEQSYLLSLAALYSSIGEPKLETDMLNRAIALASNFVEQAKTLISHGDALLYRLARPANAINCYNKAFELIGDSGDPKTLELIIRRSGDCLLVNHQYAEAEPYFHQWLTGAKGDDLFDASDRLALSFVGQGKNGEADETLRDLWMNLPCDKRINRAIQILNDSEGCLVTNEQVEAISQLALNCFVAGAFAERDLKTKGREIVRFGYESLCSGFLRPSALAYAYLITSAEELKLDNDNQSVIWLNLGLTKYLFGHAEDAREAYEMARSIASKSSQIDRFVAAAEVGLGDCDLLLGKREEAKRHYGCAQKTEDANIINSANLGLGEAALDEEDYYEAEQQFLKLGRIIDSYEQYIRIWLGLARVKIHFQKWEEAEFFLARGLSLPYRRDFAVRRQEIQKEYDNLPKRKAQSG